MMDQSLMPCIDLLHAHIHRERERAREREGSRPDLFSPSVDMQNSYVVERTCLYDSNTHTTHITKPLRGHTHTNARARDSLAGRPPEPHLYSAPGPSRRMKRERARIKECFRNSNLPFHSSARSAAASARRTIAQLMVRVSPTVCYLYVAVLAATVREQENA